MTSVAKYAPQDIGKLQVGLNKPHRISANYNKPQSIYANFKWGKISLKGYTQITSGAIYASQDIHKLQVGQNKPHRIYTNYKRGKICLTGYF